MTCSCSKRQSQEIVRHYTKMGCALWIGYKDMLLHNQIGYKDLLLHNLLRVEWIIRKNEWYARNGARGYLYTRSREHIIIPYLQSVSFNPFIAYRKSISGPRLNENRSDMTSIYTLSTEHIRRGYMQRGYMQRGYTQLSTSHVLQLHAHDKRHAPHSLYRIKRADGV